MTNYGLYQQADFLLRDDLQDVSAEIGSTTIEDLKATNAQDLNYKEALLGASLGLEPSDQVMLLGCDGLDGTEVSQGDVLIDENSARWTVLSSRLHSFGTTPVYFTLVVRKQLVTS